MVDFADLIESQTLDDVRAAFSSAATAVSWAVDKLPPLARLRKLADVAARTIYAMTQVQAAAIRGGFRDFASGVWLEALAEQVYGLEGGKITETFATTTVTFTNASNEPYSFAAGEVIVGNAVTGKTYTCAAFDLAAFGFAGATVDVAVIAVEAGTGSNADPGDITEIVGSAYDGVTVTNATAAVAVDTETDEALRVRCEAALAEISPDGAALAYTSIALNAVRVDDTPIGVTKVQVVQHVPDMGDVTVYLADGDGIVAPADVTIIDEEIRDRVLPLGVSYVDTYSATPVTVAITYSATARADDGLTAAEIEDLVEAALIELFASPKDNPIGGNIIGAGPTGTLFASKIRATIEQVRAAPEEPQPIVDVTLTLPAADVTLNPGEVAVLGTITPTVTLF